MSETRVTAAPALRRRTLQCAAFWAQTAWNDQVDATGASDRADTVWRLYDGHSAPLFEAFMQTVVVDDKHVTYDGEEYGRDYTISAPHAILFGALDSRRYWDAGTYERSVMGRYLEHRKKDNYSAQQNDRVQRDARLAVVHSPGSLGATSLVREIGITIVLLTFSNVFMTFAWYAHLRELSAKPWVVAALISWGVAFFEYMLQVPANRIGFGVLTLGQLKILQEVIALTVFVPFVVFYMKEPLKLDYLWAGLCILAAAYFIFRGS